MAELLHTDAVRLWSDSLAASDRVLVLGASGWFGRTATALLQHSAGERLLIAGTAREFDVVGTAERCSAWNWGAIAAFAPTVVIDCAFLTRDLVGGMSLDEYVERNRALTANLLAATGIPTVRRVLTISSGAAVYPVDALSQPIAENPYGRLKREAEQQLAALGTERGIHIVIARAWSVSGAFVQKPRSYALSDMILQARTGAIEITASMPVYRRYAAVDDLLAVSIAQAVDGGRTLIDSGGELVEMNELAATVAEVVNPAARISRARLGDGAPNRYYSDGTSWSEACAEVDLQPAALSQQVALAAAGLSGS